MNNLSVLVIYTGGTIGMYQDPIQKVLRPLNFEQVMIQVPELRNFEFDLQFISFQKPLDSSEFLPKHWEDIADMIYNNYQRYNGFVILHGTDTMAYTACALSFMLQNLNKPVVLTGSQIPIGNLRTDAKENLITAIEIASGSSPNAPKIAEVCLYFDYRLYRGNRTKKHNSEKFEAFISPNYPQLAEAGISIQYNRNFIINALENNNDLILKKGFNTDISILKMFPGITEGFVENIINYKPQQALIVETFGSGNATKQPWFTNLLQKAIENNTMVLNITQCTGGNVQLGRYSTSSRMLEIGVIGGFDMTFEAAVTKTMFLLAQNLSLAQLKQAIVEPIAGELTV